MVRLFAATLFALAAVAASAPADDKKDDKDKPALSGTWTREAGGLDIKFEFLKDKKDVVKVSAMAGDNGVVVTAKYEVKDGRVKLTVTDAEEKGEFPNVPKKGMELSFKWSVKGDTATLDDLEGEGLDEAKPVLEGEYARKKAKD